MQHTLKYFLDSAIPVLPALDVFAFEIRSEYIFFLFLVDLERTYLLHNESTWHQLGWTLTSWNTA